MTNYIQTVAIWGRYGQICQEINGVPALILGDGTFNCSETSSEWITKMKYNMLHVYHFSMCITTTYFFFHIED